MIEENKDLYKNRINALREEMKKERVDVYFVSGLDCNLSSSSDEYYDTIKYLTGLELKGDASLLVLDDRVYLFTDSRYKDDVLKSIDPRVFIPVLSSTISASSAQDEAIIFYINRIIPFLNQKKVVFAADASTVPYSSFRGNYRSEDSDFKDLDLVNRIWTDRPKKIRQTLSDVENLVFNTYGENVFTSRNEKLYNLISFLNARSDSIDALFTIRENEINYILNLRNYNGGYTQSAHAMLLLLPNQGYLFTDARIEQSALNSMRSLILNNEMEYRIIHLSYDSINEIFPSVIPQKSRVAVSLGCISLKTVILLTNSKFLGFDWIDNSPSEMMSIKSAGERMGMQKAHTADAVAFARFMADFDEKTTPSNMILSPLTEREFIDDYIKYKKQNTGYITESFKPIFAFEKGGKCPHYDYEREEKTVDHSSLVVMDTGSQYEFGTTDCTRTLIAGDRVDERWIHDYTTVLKAQLSVLMGHYKEGRATGFTLDTIARSVLWKENLDYEHGTGHSIDCWGNVHADAPRLSARHSLQTEMYLKEGMIFSVEPGLYSRQDYGIRIENVVVVEKENEKSEYLSLKSLTMCPYERRLIDKDSLTKDEIQFINDYHKRIYDTVSEELLLHSTDKKALEYLKDSTKPL